MGLEPKRSGNRGWIDFRLAPPCGFIAVTVDFAVVAAAERHGELVADFSPERAALGEAQMVGITRLAAADQARLLSDEPDVVAVTDPPWLRQCQR